ncbi:thiol-disulfide oxidoreductase DCC family protein [Mesonia aquimarina]|uniref:thiol-disulfide oxidoreductase DCC family protein n=1 Tax=Mesonia aquimarina TaxID=1504967 RepID=UPI001F08B144|nr:DCC1-like thiol-disulfide oxidoreductase family protein [Mesonia aquimarina]
MYTPQKPHLIWDGNCGFCHYWKIRWQKKLKGEVVFETFQNKASFFEDIPLKEFKKSSKLIDTEGRVFNGPDSAYRILYLSGQSFWHQLYQNSSWFMFLSDHAYNHIAKNRGFYFKLTKIIWGKNPKKPKPYWLFHITIGIFLVAYFFI